MTERKYYHKLIRDRIPEIIQSNGCQCSVMKLDPQQYRIELLKKLLEEAKEAVDAKNAEDLLMELGDVQEVIDALLKSIGKTRNELDVLQSKRREDRGAFDQCLFLEWSEG